MKNNYRIENDIVYIELTNKKGERYETSIDLEEFDRVDKANLSWHLEWNKYTESYYCAATKYLGTENGKELSQIIRLHKFILQTGYGVRIDHKNNNTLDNRKDNLRISNHTTNGTNRKSKNKNNTSGYRNVMFIKNKDQWCVKLQVDGKPTILGWFDDVDEAGEFAEEMRKKYYKEYAGKN